MPTIIFGSSFVSSLIQGKTPEEAIQIIAEQLDALFGRVEILETKQSETEGDITEARLEIERLRLENENLKLEAENIKANQECNELARTLPNLITGYQFFTDTPDIVSFYKRTEEILSGNYERFNLYEGRNNVDVEAIYEKAKPLYENYISECGE